MCRCVRLELFLRCLCLYACVSRFVSYYVCVSMRVCVFICFVRVCVCFDLFCMSVCSNFIPAMPVSVCLQVGSLCLNLSGLDM
jgi:hypothetical protein